MMVIHPSGTKFVESLRQGYGLHHAVQLLTLIDAERVFYYGSKFEDVDWEELRSSLV